MFYGLGAAIGPLAKTTPTGLAPKQGPPPGSAATAGTKTPTGLAPKQGPPPGSAATAGTKGAPAGGGGILDTIASGARSLFSFGAEVAPTAVETYETVQAARGRPGLGLRPQMPQTPSWVLPVVVVLIVGGIYYYSTRKA